MLKHVEQAVAVYALKWFQKYETGLAAMYATQAELDEQFRGRLQLLRERAHDFEHEASVMDPDQWTPETALGAFQASLMLKDAMDAAGPLLLKRVHRLIQRQAELRGALVETVAEARARAAKGANHGRRRTDHQRDFAPKRRAAANAIRASKNKSKARRKKAH